MIKLMIAFSLPTNVTEPLPADELYKAMLQDKKITAGRIRLILPTSLGSCTFVDDITATEIKQAITSLQEP